MSNVIDLKKKPPVAASHPNDGQYFCTRCDTNQFYLTALGFVTCVGCGAQMRNLLVSPT